MRFRFTHYLFCLLGAGLSCRPQQVNEANEKNESTRSIEDSGEADGRENTPLPAAPGRDIEELTLLRSFEIEGPDNFQPSGLYQYRGQLLTVSDKHDSAIFKLSIDGAASSMKAELWRSWSASPALSGELDFEGISLNTNGDLLLVSEIRAQVLAVPVEGEPYWEGPSYLAELTRRGLFQASGAIFEGITLLPEGSILLAAERQPRALVEVSLEQKDEEAQVWTLPKSRYPIPNPEQRHPDFTGLAMSEGDLFVLYRSSHLVVQMVRDEHGYHEGDAWSFAETENADEYLFEDSTYGRAEGLVVTKDRVMIVLDNNGDFRLHDTGNSRPLFFEFERPRTRPSTN